MRHTWQRQIHRLILIIIASIVIGWPLHAIAITLCISLGIYSAWSLYQLIRLFRWLRDVLDGIDAQLPETHGLYGQIFDGIHLLQRRNREALETSQQVITRIQSAAQVLKDGIVMIDADGQLEWWNDAAEKLLGFDVTLDVGQDITNLIRLPEFKRYFNADAYQEPLALISPANHRAHLQLHITRVSEHERLMLVRDVTRLHYLEQMRRDFFANVSHELRTPLTVIKGYVETLLDTTPPETATARALTQMSQQTKRMDALVNDLLLLNRLETDKTKSKEKIAVDNLLNQIIVDAQALSGDKQHHISLEQDSAVQLIGTSQELHSAISNLVFNAVKYTPPQKAITLRSELTENGLRISICDEGIGIEPQHIPRLTERFYRVDSSRHSETGGTGLGLAIVKHVLMRHEATLEICSEFGKGSTFSCLFPMSRVRQLEH